MCITEQKLVDAYANGNPHERFSLIYKNYEVRITTDRLYMRLTSLAFVRRNNRSEETLSTYDHFIRETFGKRRLIDVKYTDVKKFYYSLITEKGLSPATVDNVHTLLHPAFAMAVRVRH